MLRNVFWGKNFHTIMKQLKSAKNVIFKGKKVQNDHILDNEFIKVTKTK